MLFNSFEFAAFFLLAFAIYWGLIGRKRVGAQNVFLIIASYIFYGWWDWRFLTLIVVSSLVDFIAGYHLYHARSRFRRRFLLGASLAMNLGILGFFKYFNFFIDSFVELLHLMGFQANPYSLMVILPVGVSFYTFQTLSYTIDIYYGKIAPTKDWKAYFAYVSFFPQLVAGPIERAGNMIPQFLSERKFEYRQGTDGLRHILWGLFKKIAVADTCAVHVDYIFGNYETLGGGLLALGVVLFAFQIYGDFSGYSDIAIGTARLFGFSVMKNFRTPYFSRDIAEFWRRWHISLSTWFRDYVYIPLGGSRVPRSTQALNILIVFAVSGLWHGANWTFLVWGLLNGLFYIPLLLAGLHKADYDKRYGGKIIPPLQEAGLIGFTFLQTTLAWVFFRSSSVTDAFHYLGGILSGGSYSLASYGIDFTILLFKSAFAIVIMLVIEWINRREDYEFRIALSRPARWGAYLALIFLAYLLGNFESQIEFIYFQF